MKLSVRNLILMMLMIVASGMAVALKPTNKIADRGPKVELEALIPISFGEWQQDIVSSAQIVDPQQQATIDKIYSQTLSRTYVNVQGYRIMLSIAYGGDQSDAMQLHKPEVCYPSQGFSLMKLMVSAVPLEGRLLAVTRMIATHGQRTEPVTYWTTVGEYVVRGTVQKKLAELRYSLKGEIPDGLLFRVSSIDAKEERAFAAQDKFILDIVAAIPRQGRDRIAGIATAVQ